MDKIRFVLFEKLAKLDGLELYMLIGGIVLFVALVIVVAISGASSKKDRIAPNNKTRALVYGALCVTLSFVLSYIKLFSMPLGGSITLFSMLPICAYACWFGPAYGFTAAFAYSVLQIIQGAYIVHWAQFIIDYFLAFTCFGLASFFPKKLPLGVAVAGIARMLCSVLSGVIFFADSAAEAGFSSAIVYSFAYNGLTIGVDTLLCTVVAFIPFMKRIEKFAKAA